MTEAPAIVARAVWFVVSLPFRAVFWLWWQFERGGYALAGALQRAVGQRNAILLIALVMGLYGVGRITGIMECQASSRACMPGWDVPEGLLFIGFAGLLAFQAVRHVPNERRSNVDGLANFSVYRYRSEDWRLSWGPVLTVAVILAGLYAVLRLTGRL